MLKLIHSPVRSIVRKVVTSALGQGVGGLVPPSGFIFQVDADGVYLIDADGVYLVELI